MPATEMLSKGSSQVRELGGLQQIKKKAQVTNVVILL